MVFIDGHHLTIQEIVRVARFGEKVQISLEGQKNIQKSEDILIKILETGKPVYGINTGFGIFADRRIPLNDSAKLSRNLILSHAVSVGEPFPVDVVRAAMLVRANTLTKGYSGIRLKVVEVLIDMLNKGVTPIVPSQGSLGSSGDLCLLSNLALVFTFDNQDREQDSGYAWFDGQILSGKEAMRQAEITRVVLGPKEGLAINNGATFSSAMAALAVWDAERLCSICEAGLALSLEALLGCSSAFDERLHAARGQHGQIVVSKQIRRFIDGSTMVDASGRVQDAYSLRCAPQVQGAVRDTIEYVRGIIEIEINAATDNPLLFEEDLARLAAALPGRTFQPDGFARRIKLDRLGVPHGGKGHPVASGTDHPAGDPDDRVRLLAQLDPLVQSQAQRPVGDGFIMILPERPAGNQQPPDAVQAQPGPGADRLLGQRIDPAYAGGKLAPHHRRLGRPFDQARRPLPVLPLHRVADRLGRQPLLLVPQAGPLVQAGQPLSLLRLQAAAQQVAKQPVDAVPLPPVVQGRHEQIVPLELLQQRRRALRLQHRVAQRAAHPLQDRGAQQKALHPLALAQRPGSAKQVGADQYPAGFAKPRDCASHNIIL